MNGLNFKFVNGIIQALVIILLLFNGIKNSTLGLFELILTLIAVTFNFLTEYVIEE